jgi:hypothetical protein
MATILSFVSARRSLGLGLALLASACDRAPVSPADVGPSRPVVEYVTKQEILTPLPLRVRLPAAYGAERVLVFVHLWGARHWDTIELAREGQSWQGEVSCRAVSTVTGDARYFFLALDGEGQAVVGSGSPSFPHVATIVGELPEGPQALAGQPVPDRCFDPADCPPDFPGCPANVIVRPSCRSNADCPSGGRCGWDGYCDAAPVPYDETLDEDEQLAAAVRRATRKVRTATHRTQPLAQ